MIGNRPLTSRFPSQVLALVATILATLAPLAAAAPRAADAAHHLVRPGHDTTTATHAVPAGAAMPCCPAGMGQAGDSGCSELLCTVVPGTLSAAPAGAAPARLLRDYFPVPHGGLTPLYPRPEHGPPRA